MKVFLYALVWVFMVASQQVMASPFDRLVMPGKLISAHEKYEKTCEKCHESFKKEKQDDRCLACHKKVNEDIKGKVGFHGINKEIKKRECKFCHTDHIGRDAEIVNFDQHTFNHEVTNFKLKGSHKNIACNACHETGKKYRGVKKQCIDCHKDNDIHKQRLGKVCGDCHNEKSWKKGKFDHKKTKFKLKGKHLKVACNDCHPNQQYKPTTKKCVGCHRLQDVHRKEYGVKCEKCHDSKKWKNILFDHKKDTKFELKFRHAKLICSSCHKGDVFKDKDKKNREKKRANQKKKTRVCFDCHKSDDKHASLYGKKCETCHQEKSWVKITFNHDKDTKFILKESHAKAECGACHKGPIYKEDLKKDCYTCHQVDDVHNGSQGKNCTYCHNQIEWDNKIIFEHDLSSFPLIGLHSLVACEACHTNSEYKIEKVYCSLCHEDEDVHETQLSDDCVLCHNPNGWRQWVFSHNDQTDYKLTDSHEGLDCLSCHKDKVAKGKKLVLSDKCNACHEEDDVHSGRFGKRCEKCHKMTKFEELIIN